MTDFPKYLAEILANLRLLATLPKTRVSLMRSVAEKRNDPFYAAAVDTFFGEARSRHRKLPFVRKLQYGVAMFELPISFQRYLLSVNARARRELTRAVRTNHEFAVIDYNAHIADIADILRSKPVRQGLLAPEILQSPALINNAPSRDSHHDYLYFGVLNRGRLCAYMGCLIAGEAAVVGDFFSHKDDQKNCVSAFLLVNVAAYCSEHYPRLRYLVYDTYFGGSRSLREFKKKYNFKPFKVEWHLG
jgi:hypothetical protein